MHSRFLVALFGAMIFSSAFLSFVSLPPTGSAQSPFARVLAQPGLIGSDLTQFLALPALPKLFLLTFILALITAVVALLGWAPRFLALVTGLLPLGVFLYAWFGGRGMIERFGVTLPSGAFGETLSRLAATAGWGFWLWIIGAVLMSFAALFDDGIDD